MGGHRLFDLLSGHRTPPLVSQSQYDRLLGTLCPSARIRCGMIIIYIQTFTVPCNVFKGCTRNIIFNLNVFCRNIAHWRFRKLQISNDTSCKCFSIELLCMIFVSCHNYSIIYRAYNTAGIISAGDTGYIKIIFDLNNILLLIIIN